MKPIKPSKAFNKYCKESKRIGYIKGYPCYDYKNDCMKCRDKWMDKNCILITEAEEKKRAIKGFIDRMIKDQEELPGDIIKIVNDNIKDLLA